jgi:hypothetical protein
VGGQIVGRHAQVDLATLGRGHRHCGRALASSHTDNRITAGAGAINLRGPGGPLIASNWLAGSRIALFLSLAHGNKIVNNAMNANWQVVLLIYGTNDNKIIRNRIVGPRHSGVSFEDDNQGNRQGSHGNQVHADVVTCAAQCNCVAVSCSAQIFARNQISGNKLR